MYINKKREKAPPGKNLDPSWDAVRREQVKVENARLLNRFKQIQVEKQLDNRLKVGIPINNIAHKKLERQRISEDNQRMCVNLNRTKSMYPIHKYIKEHSKNTNKFERVRRLRTQKLGVESGVRAQLRRDYSILKRNKELNFGTPSQSRPFTAAATASMKSDIDFKVNGLSLTKELCMVGGEAFSLYSCMRYENETEQAVQMKRNNKRILHISLRHIRTRRNFRMNIPHVDLQNCFRAFPRLLEEENFKDLVSFVLELLHYARGNLSLDLGPIARLGHKLEREAKMRRRSGSNLSQRPKTMSGSFSGGSHNEAFALEFRRRPTIEDFKTQFGSRHNLLKVRHSTSSIPSSQGNTTINE
mmetsp:Transcript_39205/g.62805  ORF Transcript_39205/g.62805 Transcript_39205/m.62805 type:complete len:358 (-) Transcript_39205:166-1239(-)